MMDLTKLFHDFALYVSQMDRNDMARSIAQAERDTAHSYVMNGVEFASKSNETPIQRIQVSHQNNFSFSSLIHSDNMILSRGFLCEVSETEGAA
jgi:hypothetical protein